jgi:hypothetical protein
MNLPRNLDHEESMEVITDDVLYHHRVLEEPHRVQPARQSG